MADSVVVYGIGLISQNQGNLCAHMAEVDISLQALWASFLLLHLGGPDTITAFSLEDNSLWGQHLLGLIFQVVATVYLFVRIFPSDTSLVIPTMLVFLAGVIKKRGEDTVTLSLEPLETQGINSPMAWNIMVFIGDLMFKDYESKMSQNYFHKVYAIDALRVISIKLNFMYEVFHTKALVKRSKWSYIFRFVAFIDLAVALVLFNRLKKQGIPKLDVDITYSLIFGGMALDMIALFMLIFSDWTVAGIKWYNIGLTPIDSFLPKLLSTMDNLRKPQSAACGAEPNANVTYSVLDTPFIFRRWSESIFACNFLSEFLKQSPRKLHQHGQS
ncbi:uncharacterized protein LOC125314760 [Rhodamnia argentea]|uniref:Uncharacterized protein LOC125314760 n=1 Tax=Rhodamnia argentea TaxID=178133 RepID=A0ABM3HB01_9MYRT|nr:uncharacterized protein LOC125314760 [Rhodamnia argentea]